MIFHTFSTCFQHLSASLVLCNWAQLFVTDLLIAWTFGSVLNQIVIPPNAFQYCLYLSIFFYGPTVPSGPEPSHCWEFTTALRHTALGRTSLDEWSVRRTELYWTTQNTHKRQTPKPPTGFKPAIPAVLRPHRHWDRLLSIHTFSRFVFCDVILSSCFINLHFLRIPLNAWVSQKNVRKFLRWCCENCFAGLSLSGR